MQTTDEISPYVIHAIRLPKLIMQIQDELSALDALTPEKQGDQSVTTQLERALCEADRLANELVTVYLTQQHCEGAETLRKTYRAQWEPAKRFVVLSKIRPATPINCK